MHPSTAQIATPTPRPSWGDRWALGLGALLTGIPLAVVRFQLLEADPSMLIAAWVSISAIFPAGFFLLLAKYLPSTWKGRLVLLTAAGGYVITLLLHHVYFLGRGGVPHLRQLSQLDELGAVGPLLLPLLSFLAVFLVLAPPLGLGVLQHSRALGRKKSRPRLLLASLALWVSLLLLCNAAAATVLEYRTQATMERLRVYEPNQMVAKLGFVSYWQSELAGWVRHRRHPLHQSFPGTVRELLEKATELPTTASPLAQSPRSPSLENLIWIQLESLDPSAVEGPGGRLVMPFLHRLTQEGAYFANFWAQHSGGGTSDAELSSLTSLLPLATHAGLQTLDAKNHLALPELLSSRGYRTLAFHGYRPSYYGRNQYLPNIGFAAFHAGREFTGIPAKLPLADQPAFDAALSIIESTAEPFFALMITVQGHGPHADRDTYLKQMRDVDRALETFISGLRDRGLLQRSHVFIYGDHLSTPATRRSHKERVPFLVLSPPPTAQQSMPFFDITAPASHLDLAPTALALLGIEQPLGWLGNSLMGPPNRTPVALFNDLAALRSRTPNRATFVKQPDGMPALLYSASRLDP